MSESKPRLMVMSDHSCLHTGFANVTRHILNYLFDLGKYEIAEFGWFAPYRMHVEDSLVPRWKVYVTDQSNQDIAQRDQYGVLTLEGAIADFQPDVLLTVGDEWMVRHVPDIKKKYGFTWIGYTPIDGHPHPPEWTDTFRAMTYCVAYGPWGVKVMKQRNPKLTPLWIAHGVETDVYKPDKAGRKIARDLMRVADDEFLIGFVGRNQPRKMIPIVFKAFAMWSKPHYICPKTKKPWIASREEWYINELFHSFSDLPYAKESRDNPDAIISPFTGYSYKDAKDVKLISHPKAKVYFHCALNDVGWNIPEQIRRYRLDGRVVYKDDLRVGHGVSDVDLAQIYNAFDVFTLPTIGEGFGLPILEAMSCGVPIAVTDYSGHMDWCREAGVMLKVGTYFTESFTNIERAIVDNTALVNAFDHLYRDKEAYKRYAHNGRFIAERMDWQRNILPQWKDIVDYAIAHHVRPEIGSGAEEIIEIEVV